MIDAVERAKRLEAYDFSIATVRLEGMEMPLEASEIMLSYVDGNITKEQEKTSILALLR